ncbi:MAG: DUF4032 domain-containing protein [Propionibacteriaceae bacterium]|nr:DUF4032 domain-containing protein [Propionibacteriaceae bacterium]
MPHFVSLRPDAALIPLPWATPLDAWPDDMLVALPRGLSRHVVKFIGVGDAIYAAKEINAETARHEFQMLTDLNRLGQPAVEPVGIVTDRVDDEGLPLDDVLLTRHLQFALPYRSLFTRGMRHDTVTRLLDALVVLVVRLHLVGFMWGDITLSNVLFRRDAETFSAYLVDAETGELYNRLSNGQRRYDIDNGMTNIFGDFLDLQAGGFLDSSLDPANLVKLIETRYRELWAELTVTEEFSGTDLGRIEHRVRRLNALGFDVAELDIDASLDDRIKIRPVVVEPGHHSRRLMRLTGLDTEENQARRLLSDLDSYRARAGLQHVDESIAAHQWLTRVFEPVLAAIPPELQDKRESAQLYHELLDYRWFQAQRESRDVPLDEALPGYINDVLMRLPDEVLPAVVSPADQPSDDEEPVPEDPWDIALESAPQVSTLDRAALLARKKK